MKPADEVQRCNAILGWMRKHRSLFVDSQTGELDLTSMVEVWDSECADGSQTLDPDHVAWFLATTI